MAAVIAVGMAQAAPIDDAARAVRAYRDDNGRVPLVASAELMRAAQAHATDMLAQDYFGRTSKDGFKFTDRITAQGIKTGFAAKNTAFGATSGDAAIDLWINSAPHKKNILHRKAKQYGLGQAGKYRVMVLAAPC